MKRYAPDASPEKIKWTLHALKRIRERKISAQMVVNAIISGEIIEQYHSSKPFRSGLVFNAITAEPLHVVVSFDDDSVYLITAYIPNLSEWESDYKTRKGKSNVHLL